MSKKILEMNFGTGGCNGDVTAFVYKIQRLKAKGFRVRLRFSCYDCDMSFKTEDYELEIVDAGPFMNNGDGKIYVVCPRCKKRNSYGSYCWD